MEIIPYKKLQNIQAKSEPEFLNYTYRSSMKYLIIFIGFLTTNAIACGDDFPPQFVPFAVELEERQVEAMSVFEVNFPIRDYKERELYLSNINVYLDDLFSFSLEYSEWPKYKDRYYTAHLTISKEIASKIKLNASYLSGNKEGTRRVACINSTSLGLSRMLENASLLTLTKDPDSV